MKSPATLLALSIPLLLSAKPADLVLRNGKIVTVDKEFRVAKSLAIQDGRIMAISMDATPESWMGKGTKVVDLCGRWCFPV